MTLSRTFFVLATFSLLAIVLPDAAHAQNPQTREGFFIGLGLGWGSLGCSECDGRESGLAGHLKLGGAVSPNLLLGVETGGWVKEENDVTVSHSNLSGIVQFYPAPEGGFFVKGGVGIARLSVGSGGFTISDSGFGATVGAGYDARMGANFSVTPYGMFQYGSFEDGSSNVIQFGVGVTWH